MGLLDGDLQAIFGQAFSAIYLDGVISRTVIIGGVPWDPTSGAEETVTYPCKAQEDEWGQSYVAQSLVAADDRKIIVLQSGLEITPAPGDRITLRGVTSTIVPNATGSQPAVSQDPAATHWVLRTRT